MQIELIGCTSAGKSTLAQELMTEAQQAGIRVQKSYDYVLQRYGLGWVRPHAMRMLLLNLLAITAALYHFGQRPALFWWLLTRLRQLPPTVAVGERLKIARITSRNLGIHQLIQHAPADQLILADEGNVQIAHYLFVHLVQKPDFAAIDRYLALVPLPDLILYYKQPETLLIERTLRRGHKRIAECTPENVQRFIHHAYSTFEHLADAPVLHHQIITIDGQSHAILQQPQGSNPLLQQRAVAQLLGQLASRHRPSANLQTVERESRVVNLH